MAGTPHYVTVPAGTPVRACDGPRCRKPIYWVETPAGKRMPVDCAFDDNCRPPARREDGRGVSHHASCVDVDRFRRARK